MGEIAKKPITIDTLEKGMVMELHNEKSILLQQELNGEYIIDSIDNTDCLFIRDVKGPTGTRYMIKKETALKNLKVP